MQELSFRNDILPLKDKLFRLALRITFDRAEAEDVVQETLIRVWNKRDEWSQFGSIEAYCLTVARNLAIDRSERKDSRTVELTPEMEQASDASGPYEKLVNKERMALIHRLMNRLPEKQLASYGTSGSCIPDRYCRCCMDSHWPCHRNLCKLAPGCKTSS
jgi:RNA polymerase sigma-70 factor (ECF subfamily)